MSAKRFPFHACWNACGHDPATASTVPGDHVTRRTSVCVRDRPARLVLAALVLLASPGCSGDEPNVPQAASDGQAGTPLAAVRHESLPRAIVGVSLGMSLADAEARLGKLSCHDAASGCRVCTGAREQIDEVAHLQLYIHHDRVISLSYDGVTPSSARTWLDSLIERYGHPSLSGVRERDTSGRLHEVYGWKDEQSLYSVRLIWQDNEPGIPALVGTAIAMWDRKGYQQWEADTHRGNLPTPPAGDQKAPI